MEDSRVGKQSVELSRFEGSILGQFVRNPVSQPSALHGRLAGQLGRVLCVPTSQLDRAPVLRLGLYLQASKSFGSGSFWLGEMPGLASLGWGYFGLRQA